MARMGLASRRAFYGNYFVFSTTTLPKKAILRDFSGRWVRKMRIPTAKAAPTALRCARLAPLAVAEYVKVFPYTMISEDLSSVILPPHIRGHDSPARHEKGQSTDALAKLLKSDVVKQ